MVPCFRRDDVWIPAPGLKPAGTGFAGVTIKMAFYEFIKLDLKVEERIQW